MMMAEKRILFKQKIGRIYGSVSKQQDKKQTHLTILPSKRKFTLTYYLTKVEIIVGFI